MLLSWLNSPSAKPVQRGLGVPFPTGLQLWALRDGEGGRRCRGRHLQPLLSHPFDPQAEQGSELGHHSADLRHQSLLRVHVPVQAPSPCLLGPCGSAGCGLFRPHHLPGTVRWGCLGDGEATDGMGGGQGEHTVAFPQVPDSLPPLYRLGLDLLPCPGSNVPGPQLPPALPLPTPRGGAAGERGGLWMNLHEGSGGVGVTDGGASAGLLDSQLKSWEPTLGISVLICEMGTTWDTESCDTVPGALKKKK